MKLRELIIPAMVAALVVPPAGAMAQTYGQETERQGTQERQEQPQQAPEQIGQQDTHDVIRADRLMGQSVRDHQNERQGRIDDLAVDVKDGRIAYLVVNRGGVWGIGGDTVALQWQHVQPDPDARVVRIDRQQLQQARVIDTHQAWPAALGGEPDRPVGTAGADERRSVPMSNLINMDVQNQQGENLGRIDEIALSRDGSIRYAVIAHGGFLGMGENYVAVPWDRLTIDAEREEARLDVRREQLDQASRFDHAQRWPGRVDWPFGTDNR